MAPTTTKTTTTSSSSSRRRSNAGDNASRNNCSNNSNKTKRDEHFGEGEEHQHEMEISRPRSSSASSTEVKRKTTGTALTQNSNSKKLSTNLVDPDDDDEEEEGHAMVVGGGEETTTSATAADSSSFWKVGLRGISNNNNNSGSSSSGGHHHHAQNHNHAHSHSHNHHHHHHHHNHHYSQNDSKHDGSTALVPATPAARETTTHQSTSDEDGCLHCHRLSTEVQVRCDECLSYICPTCHWCHEYQANHEIRVCDRCDAFYCRNCDEMDQCDDCGEVVCASCSTLLSCKFCGGGLCEECATACGRCGIVLCSRDAKFAVDCDTCRLSYCLVCLASGSKDPCVRCGHRPSKRMEQLVHLRLKSIYKAFKQSSRSPKNMMATGADGNSYSMHSHDLGVGGESGPTIEELEEGMDDMHHAGLSSNHPASSRYRTKLSKEQLENGGYHETNELTSDDRRTMLYLEEKRAADEAAEALLAELEEEEEAAKTKKSKKKKKKVRQQKAKKKEDDDEELKEEEHMPESKVYSESQQQERLVEESKPRAAQSKKGGKKKEQQPTEQQHEELSVSTPYKPALRDAGSKESASTQKAGNASPKAFSSITPVSDSKNSTPKTPEVDLIEKRLLECVDQSDVDGIEEILFELKGVPGRAALRKNAKKALKRLRTPATSATDEEEQELQDQEQQQRMDSYQVSDGGSFELLKLISDNKVHGKQPNRAECVMQMSPIVVGWVIGKGGQRIRDLMEESGAKVWIDQEKSGTDDARNVYISGERKAVDRAIHMVREIVSKAPIEGASKYAPEGDPADNPQEAVVQPTTNVLTSGLEAIPSPPAMEAAATAALLTPANQTFTVPAPGFAPPVQQMSAWDPTMQQESVDHIMTCEARFVPLLIGKRGWAIKDIQDKSGARVDIDQTVTPRQIRISGPKSSVEKAIPMVRDVLSYPHAQPQTGNELSEGVDQLMGVAAALQQHDNAAARTDERPHTPPPYNYITTGDAKSAISASSSLSSTPEPSMASSSKGLHSHLATGSLIPPPDYNLSQRDSHLLAPSPSNRGHFMPHDMPRGMSHDIDQGVFAPRHQAPPPAMYGGSGLMGMQHIPGMGMPPPHPNHEMMYNQGPTPSPVPMGHGMLHGQPPLPGFGASGMASSSSAKAIHGGAHGSFGMMDHRGNSMGMPPQQMNTTPGHEAQLNRYNSMPHVSLCGGQGLIPGQIGPSAFDGHGGNPLAPNWDRNQVGGKYAPSPAMPPGTRLPQSAGVAGPPLGNNLGLGHGVGSFGNSFHPPAPDSTASGTANGASVSLGSGFGLGQTLGVGSPGPAPFGSSLDVGAPASMRSIRDDARIIDSLFGPTNAAPAGGVDGRSADPAQSILTGLQGLSLGTSDGLGTGIGTGAGSSALGGAGTGLWGDPLPDWNPATGAVSSVLDSANSNDTALETSILAGLQPFSINEDTQQHPPQSRFNWGSANA